MIRLPALLVLTLVIVCFGTTQSKVFRNGDDLISHVKLTQAQMGRLRKVDGEFGPRYASLMKKNRGQVDGNVDSLNREYTKAILRILNPKQKQQYLEAVYRHMHDFVQSHPGVDGNQVFIWGGAFASKPKN